MIPDFKFNDTKASARYGIVIYWSILTYIISLYIKNAPVISNVLMIVILLLAFISVSPKKYLQQFKDQKVNIGIILFFLLQVVSVLFSSDKAAGFNILSLRLPLFILPLAFCLIDFEQKTWRNILLFYVLVTTIASLSGFLYGSYMALQEDNTAYFYNDNISQLLLGKQAAYFGLYINIAILAGVFFQGKATEYGKVFRWGLYIVLIWLFFISYMLASKMSAISLLIVLIGLIFLRILREKKIVEGLILVMGMVVIGFVLYNLFPKTINRFKTISYTNFKYENTNPENSLDDKFDTTKWSSGSTRMALWSCGEEVFMKHPVFGTGLGDIRTELKKKYTEKHFYYAVNTNKNLHSQYLDVAISMGIIGLLFFLFAYFFYPIKTFIQRDQDFAIAVFICVGLCLLTENMFDRYMGEELIAFILPLSGKIVNKPE